MYGLAEIRNPWLEDGFVEEPKRAVAGAAARALNLGAARHGHEKIFAWLADNSASTKSKDRLFMIIGVIGWAIGNIAI